MVDGFHRAVKTGGEPGKFFTERIEMKRVTEEILCARVFIKTPDQVANGVNEILLAACWRIEQEFLHTFKNRSALVVCHPLEHFKLHAWGSQGTAARGPEQGKRDVEEVV